MKGWLFMNKALDTAKQSSYMYRTKTWLNPLRVVGSPALTVQQLKDCWHYSGSSQLRHSAISVRLLRLPSLP